MTTETLPNFTVPAKNEKWRFSGAREIALNSYRHQAALVNLEAPEGIALQASAQLTGAAKAAFEAPLYDYGSAALERLTTSPQQQGVYLRAKGQQANPIYLSSEFQTTNSHFTSRSMLELEPKSELTFIEMIAGKTTHNLALSAHRLQVGAGAKLNYVLVQDAAADAQIFNFLEISAAEGAEVNLTLINLGSAYTRQEVTAYLNGREANVQLRSLSLASVAQEIDQRTLQIHNAPSAKSDLLFKNVLDDKARTIFSGLIRVAEGAQKTDAYQKNRNLLLSADANANSLPGLEIEANDVRCTHGATSGRVSPEELFYLQARGIPLKVAQRMLVAGYCEEILSAMPEMTANWLRERIEQR